MISYHIRCFLWGVITNPCIVVAENVAFKKPAWQTSTYTATEYGPAGPAELAVDERRGGDQRVGDCTHTAWEVTAV